MLNQFVKALGFLLLLLVPVNTCAQRYIAELDSIYKLFEDNNTPFNGSLLIFDKQEELAREHKGYANFEHRIPFTDSTRFRIASLTKQFTAMLIMKLYELGEIGLEDQLGKYLKEFRGQPGGKVTIRQLLTHTSGILPNPDSYLWDHVLHNYRWDFRNNKALESFSARAFRDSLAVQKLLFEPGSKYQYNNSGYELLGMIVEQLTGLSYESALQTMILEPLGMHETSVEAVDMLVPNKAYNYDYADGKTVKPTSRFRNLHPIKASGGMISTLNDLKKWVEAVYFKSQLISKETKRQYFTPFLKNYAYGVMNMDYKLRQGGTTRLWWHTGQLSGVQTCIAYMPEQERAFIWLSNMGFSFPTNSFVNSLVNILE